MLKYILKRILLLIPVLIGATFIVFSVMDMTPGDPAGAKLGVDATAEQIEELREEMGLNDKTVQRLREYLLAEGWTAEKILDLFDYLTK